MYTLGKYSIPVEVLAGLITFAYTSNNVVVLHCKTLQKCLVHFLGSIFIGFK